MCGQPLQKPPVSAKRSGGLANFAAGFLTLAVGFPLAGLANLAYAEPGTDGNPVMLGCHLVLALFSTSYAYKADEQSFVKRLLIAYGGIVVCTITLFLSANITNLAYHILRLNRSPDDWRAIIYAGAIGIPAIPAFFFYWRRFAPEAG